MNDLPRLQWRKDLPTEQSVDCDGRSSFELWCEGKLTLANAPKMAFPLTVDGDKGAIVDANGEWVLCFSDNEYGHTKDELVAAHVLVMVANKGALCVCVHEPMIERQAKP